MTTIKIPKSIIALAKQLAFDTQQIIWVSQNTDETMPPKWFFGKDTPKYGPIAAAVYPPQVHCGKGFEVET